MIRQTYDRGEPTGLTSTEAINGRFLRALLNLPRPYGVPLNVKQAIWRGRTLPVSR